MGSKNYTKIWIPSGRVEVNEATSAWSNTFNGRINGDDFNTFLFVESTTMEEMKINHFKRFSNQFVFSAITTPFKIHTATAGHASALASTAVNLGTFLGVRRTLYDVGGVSAGIILGYSSINQNSSNNTAITGTESENISTLNYGLGIVFDISKKLQVGALVGWDHGFGDKSPTYIYQDKAWFALSFNFTFLDFGNTKVQGN